MQESIKNMKGNQKNMDITLLLNAWRNKEPKGTEKLMEAVYPELRKIAHGYLRKEPAAHSLQTTGLVHDAYLRLDRKVHCTWKNREHFYGIAARIMRRILVEYARARNTEKRGGGAPNLELNENQKITKGKAISVLTLDHALQDLKRIHKRQSQIVELRFFAGLDNREIARALQVSEGTVKRDWSMAKAWLFKYLRQSNLRG